MNKERLEALSDGVFAIVMTLSVFSIHIPAVPDGAYSTLGLWNALGALFPLIVSYVVSFTILALYWTSHHAFFHFFTSTIDQTLTQLNMLYLMFIVCIPFTAELLGKYHENILAVWIYGANVLVLGAIFYGMYAYSTHSPNIELVPMTHHAKIQTIVRILLTPAFALLAMFAAFVSIPFAFFLFMLPAVFNIFPTALNKVEHLCGLTIK